MSTQQGFGLILNELARSSEPIADRIVTTAPDVTVSTNLGAWVNRRGLFAKAEMKDLFRSERIPSTFAWDFGPKGQHLELGIAEMNLFILLSALGLSHAHFGERLIPIGTLYDPFINRGLDALNYACYQDARFILAATPSGVTLAPEGGAHQSINTPLIGIAQDGLASFEPAFVDELAAIMRFALDYVQRSGDASDSRPNGSRSWLADDDGGSVYLRLSTRSVDQPRREMTDELARDIVDGAYWMRKPGPNAQVVVAYAGAVAPEAIEAGRAHGRGPARRRPPRGHVRGPSPRGVDRRPARPRERLRRRALACRNASRQRAGPLRAGDGARRTSGDARLARRGSRPPHACARRRAFRPDRTIQDLYRHNGIDAQAIVKAAQGLVPGRPIRHLRAV
jgi:pyruvate dehydrogenase E1 component